MEHTLESTVNLGYGNNFRITIKASGHHGDTIKDFWPEISNVVRIAMDIYDNLYDAAKVIATAIVALGAFGDAIATMNVSDGRPQVWVKSTRGTNVSALIERV